MSRVVSLEARKSVSEVTAWRAYCDAAKRAQETMSLQDGIEAGRAWRCWLDLFMAPHQRCSISSARLPSERRQ